MFTQKKLGRVKNVATFSLETSSKVWIYACSSYFSVAVIGHHNQGDSYNIECV